VAGLPGVFLHTVDDLGDLARAGVRSRCAAVKQAEAIIETRVDSFMRWMEARRTVPVIHTLEQRAETLRAAELDRAQRMAARGVPLATVLEALADGLVNKFLHGPRVILGRGELDPNQAQALVDQWLPPQRRTSGRNWATARDRGG
jgi:glutamyl-tRNA reductase